MVHAFGGSKASPLAWLLLLAGLGRILGGAYLLHLLHAPGWAVAAWLMLHIRIRLGRRQQTPTPAPRRPAGIDSSGYRNG